MFIYAKVIHFQHVAGTRRRDGAPSRHDTPAVAIESTSAQAWRIEPVFIDISGRYHGCRTHTSARRCRRPPPIFILKSPRFLPRPTRFLTQTAIVDVRHVLRAAPLFAAHALSLPAVCYPRVATERKMPVIYAMLTRRDAGAALSFDAAPHPSTPARDMRASFFCAQDGARSERSAMMPIRCRSCRRVRAPRRLFFFIATAAMRLCRAAPRCLALI